MFANLIESGSHARDFRRKGSFFLGTFVFYAALLAAAGVGSIYAYNTHLEDQQYEVLSIMRFPPSPARIEPERRSEARPAASRADTRVIAERIEVSVIAPVVKSNKVASASTPEVSARMPVIEGSRNFDPKFTGGPVGPSDSIDGGFSGSDSSASVRVDVSREAPPEIRRTPEVKPTPKQKILTVSRILNGSAISKHAPPYPHLAKITRVSGLVAVQILIDEQGRVVSAQPTSGHPMLRQAAMQAAYQARFSPTLLGEQPVKVSGVITYNFVLQ